MAAPVEVPGARNRPGRGRSCSRAARSGGWTPRRACSESVASSALAVALRGVDLPHFVACTHVDGLEPGIYRWPDLSAPVRAGELRRELYRVALEQGLPRDAAFVVIGTADVSALDDREYREAQLAAGLVEGRLHLAAYALGAGASGMTFLDSEIPASSASRSTACSSPASAYPSTNPRSAGHPGLRARSGWSSRASTTSSRLRRAGRRRSISPS